MALYQTNAIVRAHRHEHAMPLVAHRRHNTAAARRHPRARTGSFASSIGRQVSSVRQTRHPRTARRRLVRERNTGDAMRTSRGEASHDRGPSRRTPRRRREQARPRARRRPRVVVGRRSPSDANAGARTTRGRRPRRGGRLPRRRPSDASSFVARALPDGRQFATIRGESDACAGREERRRRIGAARSRRRAGEDARAVAAGRRGRRRIRRPARRGAHVDAPR